MGHRIGCTKIHFGRHNSMTSCNVSHYRSCEQTAFHGKWQLNHAIRISTSKSTSGSYCGRLLCQPPRKVGILRIGWVRLTYVLFCMVSQFIIIIITLILVYLIFLLAASRNNGQRIVGALEAFSLSEFAPYI